ncbi:hypothetical protein [Marinobacterium sp. MBR-109]|uniref:hypothetical protein n=1 Tax=Marinobacterium sp. MBR-109 TaxID=3156462 RepID=UPI0033962F4A
MTDIIRWIVDNKEWLFSGAGVAVLVWLGNMLRKNNVTSSTQKIRTGEKSTNYQAGRDIHIGNKQATKHVEED